MKGGTRAGGCFFREERPSTLKNAPRHSLELQTILPTGEITLTTFPLFNESESRLFRRQQSIPDTPTQTGGLLPTTEGFDLALPTFCGTPAH